MEFFAIRPIRHIIAADMAQTSGNPPFSVVSTGTTVAPPPRPLGPHGEALGRRSSANMASAIGAGSSFWLRLAPPWTGPRR